MAEWHDSSCRRLDVFTSDGITSCLSCGSMQLDSKALPSEHADADKDTVYQPLESTTDIRLLTLEPGDFNDPIKCRLSLSSTASMIDYDAISYTWASEDGEMEWTERLTLNSREFLVTPNCMMALRRVRSRGAEKVIWIDAICMNQKDVEERGHQVRLMPQIYSRAQHVLIYVGEPTPEEERLIRYLRNDPIPGTPRQRLQLSLETLLNKRYFSRAWILQEVALARNAMLICGNFSMPWSMVQIPRLAALGLLINVGEEPRLLSMLQLPSVLQFRAPAYRDSSDLLHLLDLARHSHATDPRDKLFAVFGLISCGDSDGIVADYTKSTKKAYMQMAGWIAQRFGLPAMLVRAFHLDQFFNEENAVRHATSESIPSWAPNWTETPAPWSWPELAKIHQACRVGLAPAGLPVSFNLAANSLRFPILRLGRLGDVIYEYGSQARASNSIPRDAFQPWTFTALETFNGIRMCSQQFIDFHFNNPPVQSEHHRLEVYLLPEPDEYKGFSFEQVGSVSVCVDAISCTWIHGDREGRKTIGRFNRYALCGEDLGYGDVRAHGLLHMNGLAHEGVWKSGHFEYIDLVADDTAPYPALNPEFIR
ncbi:heterokaryon incompatibility protein 6, OR allele [Colletotrichum spaethianum]|uniref:Heterokaryon incompatibility protein 6, OR allele n=1 Tax=Colletotrichum spaethianum TaxID=700344 RepID=A0AA37NYG0_9PEZI|nr:heterokaryon incompatibility protein 6, OR allele [Colletotrichum spaethianum]GKT43370.1 heterokaryon incompatibility protein 6, OR allele [Colletotrichum spaethianum]